MPQSPRLRRLFDLPGVADLELKALMKRDYAEPEARETYPDIDACTVALFGLSGAAADAVARPQGWDGIDDRPVAEQVEAFAAEGWDVTDDKRRPLRMLGHLAPPLWLALRGVAGTLPFQPDEEPKAGGWGASLAADAARFRRR